MEFSAIIRSIVIRPGVVYARIGKEEVEIPRPQAATLAWLDDNTKFNLENMIALALKAQLEIDPVLANAPAALQGKRVKVTVTLETP